VKICENRKISNSSLQIAKNKIIRIKTTNKQTNKQTNKTKPMKKHNPRIKLKNAWRDNFSIY